MRLVLLLKKHRRPTPHLSRPASCVAVARSVVSAMALHCSAKDFRAPCTWVHRAVQGARIRRATVRRPKMHGHELIFKQPFSLVPRSLAVPDSLKTNKRIHAHHISNWDLFGRQWQGTFVVSFSDFSCWSSRVSCWIGGWEDGICQNGAGLEDLTQLPMRKGESDRGGTVAGMCACLSVDSSHASHRLANSPGCVVFTTPSRLKKTCLPK